MCLITNQKTPKIAKEDLKVYKVLWQDLSTIYTDFKYEGLNILHKTEFTFVHQFNTWYHFGSKVENWLIANFPKTDKSVTGYSYNRENLICIEEGFHSALNTEDFTSGFPVYECTIPKGSKYYRDGAGYIVSNQIIINKQIDAS